MNLYEDQFSESYDFPSFTGKTKDLIIASTPRCGSHMLGHLLYSTKSLGYPLEYLNPANLKRWQRITKKNKTSEIINEVRARRTSPNGVFSCKVHYSHVMNLGGFSKIFDTFRDHKVVLVTRADLAKQAISFYVASRTGVWIHGQKPVAEHPKYDFEEIMKKLDVLRSHNSLWRMNLCALGIPHMEVRFEDLVKNSTSEISRIADFCSVELYSKTDFESHMTTKQGGKKNIDWLERFIEDYRAHQGVTLETHHS